MHGQSAHVVVDNTSYLPELVYIPETDVEDFEDYTIGGFHPILIGDTFQDGRCEVIHKLGYGGYSTIWLARDNKSQVRFPQGPGR